MKTRVKTILFSALGAAAIFTAVTYASCTNDKCKSIVCAFGGVCSDGSCLCPSGYEGPQCETVTRDRYIGVWVVTEDGTLTDGAQYAVTVEPGDNITELRIKNFRNLFTSDVNAFVKGDTLYIPSQTVENNPNNPADNYQLIGIGYLDADKFYGGHGQISVHYKATDAANHVDDFGYDGGDPSLWNK